MYIVDDALGSIAVCYKNLLLFLLCCLDENFDLTSHLGSHYDSIFLLKIISYGAESLIG